MIDGVTILNTYMAWTMDDIAFILIVGGFCIVVGAICFVMATESGSDWGCIISCLLFSVIFILFFCCEKTEHIQAIVDNSVSWTELTERYEVVKVDGKILTMIALEDEE